MTLSQDEPMKEDASEEGKNRRVGGWLGDHKRSEVGGVCKPLFLFFSGGTVRGGGLEITAIDCKD